MAVKRKIMNAEERANSDSIQGVRKESGSYLINFLREKFDFIIELMKRKMDEIRYEIKKRIIVVVLYGLGIFFLIFGIAQIIERLFPIISGGGGFLIIGFLLMIVGGIYGAGARKMRPRKKRRL
ncbi:MAG: hypothetical protein ABII01_04575 [Candidatus Woesearchaeota archaeon]